MSDAVVIVAAQRTAIGSFMGQFTGVPAPQLAAAAIRAALAQGGVAAAEVDEAIIGCVLPAGIGQAPARQAVLAAGLPPAVGATTINKVCGSGMKAVMLGHDLLRAGSASIVLAGGMESMTNAPHLLPKARLGYRLGNAEVVDHMMFDGLTDAYQGGAMGVFGEACAAHYAFSREAQDAFATESVQRALRAQAEGAFADEIAAVTVTSRKGEESFATDEEPPACKLDKIPGLRPAFRKDGTITAASSSKISDGAAALLLMKASTAAARSAPVLARIAGHATHAQEPEWFTTAPVGAMRKLMQQLGWSVADVDLFEVNEAFAVVTMAAMTELGLPHEKVNVNGGACALGHPIGASGARILVTLVHALRRRGLKRGIASLCIGGGEATAVAVEID